MTEWEMSFSGPLIYLPVEYGYVYVTWTNAGHCHVTTSSPHYGAGDCVITYHSNRYRIPPMHLWAASDWTEDPRDPAVSSRPVIFAPPTYQKVITAAISVSVREYVTAHPAVLHAADLNDAQNDLTRALRAESELSDQLRTAADRLRAVRERIAVAEAELDRYS